MTGSVWFVTVDLVVLSAKPVGSEWIEIIYRDSFLKNIRFLWKKMNDMSNVKMRSSWRCHSNKRVFSIILLLYQRAVEILRIFPICYRYQPGQNEEGAVENLRPSVAVAPHLSSQVAGRRRTKCEASRLPHSFQKAGFILKDRSLCSWWMGSFKGMIKCVKRASQKSIFLNRLFSSLKK